MINPYKNFLKNIIKKTLFLFLIMFISFSVSSKEKTLIYNNLANDIYIDYEFYDTDLYSLTNTYNYNNEYNKDSEFNEYNPRYYMDNKNENIVSEDVLLTVLTHGLGGSPSNFSKYGSVFGYCDESIISFLCKKQECNVYVCQINYNQKSEKALSIFDITNDVYQGIKGNPGIYEYNHLVNNITDISKHSIVIFDGLEVSYGNTLVYEEFNYAISKIIYDIKLLNNDKLPKINLIGHSRGGLTNMEYALDHPDLVDSIYSFSTPYCSTTIGAIDYYLLDSSFSSEEAEKDLVTEVYQDYMNRWNMNYSKLNYDKIKVTSFGGYQTIDFMSMVICHEGVEDYVENMTDKYLPPFLRFRYLNTKISFLMKLLEAGVMINYIDIYRNYSLNEIMNYICFNSSNKGVNEILKILFTELAIDLKTHKAVWYNDGLVDILSQMGYCGTINHPVEGYKGFRRIYQCFDSPTLINTIKNGEGLVHAMVVYNPLFLNTMKNEIKLEKK